MIESLSKRYVRYCDKHNGNPKYDFSHFARVVSMVSFHREHVRPKIKWLEETKNTVLIHRNNDKLNNYKNWTRVSKFLVCGLVGVKLKKIDMWFNIFKRKESKVKCLIENDFSDNWKQNSYENNVLEGVEHLKKGIPIKIHDDGRGYELAIDIKRRFILEKQKQLSEKIKIDNSGNIITIEFF